MFIQSTLRCGLLALLLCLTFAAPAEAQCPGPWSLVTTYAGGNGCSGNFFDVQANVNVTVCSFDVHYGNTASGTIEVWAVTGGGPYLPVAATPAAWTLLATVNVTGAGIGNPTPLNLNLNYLIPAGTTQGFIIRDITSTGNIDYTNGTTLGAPYASNADLTFFQGNYTCNSGTAFPVLTNAVRIWNGTIHYATENILTLSQPGPGGNLSIGLDMISPTADEAWMLISLNTSAPAGTGPLIGITPDAITFNLFLTSPLADGFPLHFPIPSPSGSFPTVPFVLPAGLIPFPAGTELDAAVLLINNSSFFDSRSGAVRYTIQ